jgi:nicotinamidase-related amidase
MKLSISRVQRGLVSVSIALLGGILHPSSQAAQSPATLRALYGLHPPLSLTVTKTALVLVDFQLEFVSGRLRLPTGATAIARARSLVDWAHRSGMLVVLVQQVSNKPGSRLFGTGAAHTAFIPELEPVRGDLVIQKAFGGGFSHTQLDSELRARRIDTVIIGGLMTHLAVLMTAIDAMTLGYKTIVAGDATATRALPGVPGELGVDAALLKRAVLDAIADRVADVMLSRDITALPLDHAS